jgi:hypothetical protein
LREPVSAGSLLLAASDKGTASTNWTLIFSGVAAAVALLALVFDNGFLVAGFTLINRRYKWEAKPLQDGHQVKARISHGYSSTRTLSQGHVVVPQRLLLRILWRLAHRQKLERWLVVATVSVKNVNLAPNQGFDLDGHLNSEVPVPTWRFWRPRKMRDPTDLTLLMLLRFDRRTRVIAKKVKEASGDFEPMPAASGEALTIERPTKAKT